jgi:predicted nuclease of predicted toxin-antitoxin system
LKIYLDNNLPYSVAAGFDPFHTVGHARDMGWQKLSNGELVTQASKHFDVILTVDKNMQFQTSLQGLNLRVIVLDSVSNRLDDLLPFVPQILNRMESLPAGTYTLLKQ